MSSGSIFLEEVEWYRKVRRGAFILFNTLQDDVKFWNNFSWLEEYSEEDVSNVTSKISFDMILFQAKIIL